MRRTIGCGSKGFTSSECAAPLRDKVSGWATGLQWPAHRPSTPGSSRGSTGHNNLCQSPDAGSLPRTGQRPIVLTVAAANLEGVAFGADAHIVAVAGTDGVLRLMQLPSGRQLRTVRIGGNGVALACAPHGSMVAVGAGNGEVWVMRYGPQASVPGLRSIDRGRHQ